MLYKKLMEDDLGWLQHLGDDPCLDIKPQYNFLSLFILFFTTLFIPGHVISSIKSILIVEWL